MSYGNLTGEKFGEAIVIGLDHTDKYRNNVWNCRCWCGKEFKAKSSDLINLKRTTCFTKNHDKIVGKKFGRLTATSDFIIENNRRKFLCKCDCGNISYVEADKLLRGSTKSCGCYLKELNKNVGKLCYRHGMTNTRIHRIWYQIICRTKYKGSTSYKNYGARGITVCEKWKTFENFYNWAMSHGYTDELTIERIDVNGNYCPDNCKWATYKEQANNMRNNRFVEYNGEKKTLSQWAEYAGIPYRTFYYRYTKYNWSIEDCINTPVGQKRKPAEK